MKPCNAGPDVMRPLTDAERGELLTDLHTTPGVRCLSAEEKAQAKRRPLWFQDSRGVFLVPTPKGYERRCPHGRMAECPREFCARLYREGA